MIKTKIVRGGLLCGSNTVAKFMPIQFYKILKVSTVLYMLKFFFFI